MVSLINSMKWDEERFNLWVWLRHLHDRSRWFSSQHGCDGNKGLERGLLTLCLQLKWNDQTATDTVTTYIRSSNRPAHYFHNWTGNRVISRDWFQVTKLERRFNCFPWSEFSSSIWLLRAVNRINNVRIIRGPQFAEDASSNVSPCIRRFLKSDEMNNFYTLTQYNEKGRKWSELHTLLGEVAFQKGMKQRLNVTMARLQRVKTFVAAMEDGIGCWICLSSGFMVAANQVRQHFLLGKPCIRREKSTRWRLAK